VTTQRSKRSLDSYVLKGYGPVVAVVALLLAMVAFVPSKSPVRQQVAALGAGRGSSTGTGSTSGGTDALVEGAASDPAAATGTADGSPGGTTDGATAGGGTTSGGRTGGATAGAAAGGAGAETGVPAAAGVRPCPDRPKQDPNSAYSPPCVEFSGDNGGATSRGVTADKIILSVRRTAPLDLGGAAGEVQDDQADVERTQRAYVEYFNKKLQLYGRQVELRYFDGQGDATEETLGGGQEGANADAITVAQQIQAFGEVSGGTPPYADALVRQKVMAFGPIHMSREWYTARRPYSWAVLVDCTVLTETTVNYMANRLVGKPAKFAGDSEYRQKTRAFGLIVPENPWYQECANRSEGLMKQKGFGFTKRINYPLDINQASQIAANMVAQMKSAGVTTFVCWCDPIAPIFVTTQATQQDYWPEWLVTGTVLTDSDALGQLYDQEQWAHAFGHSSLSEFGGADNEAYRAYKAVRTDEPSNNYRLLYTPLLQIFLGLQLAGPNLTPETYEQGMFSYPPAAGESGRWDFGPGDYTATSDAREIYWDKNGTSPANGAKGRYITTLDGQRFMSDWPKGEPPFPDTPTNS